jgi:cell division protein FtsB
MADLITHVKTINSTLRTLLLVGVTGAMGYGGWVGYDNYVRPAAEAKQAKAELEELKAQFEKQRTEMAELTQAKQRLETAMKLLKVNQRIARIEVMEKGVNEEKQPYMEVRFSEVDRNGEVIGSPRDFTILGEKIYVDGWIVTFEDNYVEHADELRAASLFVFKSIFGELERPADAKRLDTQSDALPGIYKSASQNEFEKKIWNDFWKVSGNSKLQKELGIRASHGQANYLIGEQGKSYQVEIRASGGMSLKPLDDE